MMRPDSVQANEFESALLNRILAVYPDVRLAIADLRVLSRTFSGVGSFTDFRVDGWPKESERRVLTTDFLVAIPGLQNGLGVIAFLDGNGLMLETYSFGDETWDGDSQGYTIGPDAMPIGPGDMTGGPNA